MRTCFRMDPLTIDPRKAGDAISSTLIFMLYEGMTQVLPSGQIALSLAESVDISKDGRTYVFFLKKAHWNDGQPITAYDFEYSWKKTLDPTFPASFPQLFFSIQNAEAASQGRVSLDSVGIQAIDERTLKVELEHSTPYFLSLLSCCNFFPIPRHVELANSSWDFPMHSLISNGPFQLMKWEPKKEILVKKNPFYWDAENTSLPGMNISIVNNEFTTLEMFEHGELDWVSSILGALPTSALRNYHREKKLTLTPTASTVFCAYNMQQFPFHNENIRKAFFLSIDRSHLVDQVTQFDEIPAKRLISSLLDHQDVELLPPFNPVLARQTLQKGLVELGVIKNREVAHEQDDLKLRLFLKNLTLSYDDAPVNRQVAKSLQEQWRRHLGYRIQLAPLTFGGQTEAIYRRDFNIALRCYFPHYNDSMSLLERFKYKNLPRNFPKFESAHYIELLNLASQVHPSGSSRNEILLEAESHLLESMAIAPLYHGNYPVLSHPTVSGVSFTAIGNVQFKRAKCMAQKAGYCKVAVS